MYYVIFFLILPVCIPRVTDRSNRKAFQYYWAINSTRQILVQSYRLGIGSRYVRLIDKSDFLRRSSASMSIFRRFWFIFRGPRLPRGWWPVWGYRPAVQFFWSVFCMGWSPSASGLAPAASSRRRTCPPLDRPRPRPLPRLRPRPRPARAPRPERHSFALCPVLLQVQQTSGFGQSRTR